MKPAILALFVASTIAQYLFVSFDAYGRFSVGIDGERQLLEHGDPSIAIDGRRYFASDGGFPLVSQSKFNGSDLNGEFNATTLSRRHNSGIELRTDVKQYWGSAANLVIVNTTYVNHINGTSIVSEKGETPISAMAPFRMGSGLLAAGQGYAKIEPLYGLISRFSDGGSHNGPVGAGAKLPLAVVYDPAWRQRVEASTGRPVNSTLALAFAPLTHTLRSASAIIQSPGTNGNKESSWGMGIQSSVDSIPAGTWHATAIVAGYAVGGAVRSLGEHFKARYPLATNQHEQVLQRDLMTRQIGAWGDNGAWLNMNKWIGNTNMNYNPMQKGHAPQDLVVSLVTKLHASGIPVGYMQLDDWYYSGRVAEGAVSCVDDWDARGDWFPDGGLSGLHQAMGGNVTIMGYIPWICSTATYFTNGSYIYIPDGPPQPMGIPGHGGGISKPCPWPSDPSQACAASKAVPALKDAEKLYTYMLSHAKEQGVGIFEQDFIGQQGDQYGFQACLDCAEDWLQAQHSAYSSLDIPAQQCLASTGDILLAAKSLPYVTNARASSDYAGCTGYDIALSGMLIDAFGVRPFHDNMWTRSVEPGNPYTNTTLMPSQYAHCPKDPYRQPNPKLDVIVSALSGGPVGIGDGPGFTDVDLVMSTIRADGHLLRPDRHAVPSEMMFMDGAPDAGTGPGLQTNTTRINLGYSRVPALSSNDAAAPTHGGVRAAASAMSFCSYTLLAIDVPSDLGVLFDPVGGNAQPQPPSASCSYVAVKHGVPCRSGSVVGSQGSCATQVVSLDDPMHVYTEPGVVDPVNGTHGFAMWTLVEREVACGGVGGVGSGGYGGVGGGGDGAGGAGWVLLGEEGKVVRLSRDRVTSVAVVDESGLVVGVMGAAGEEVTMAAVDEGGVIRLQSVVIGEGGKGAIRFVA